MLRKRTTDEIVSTTRGLAIRGVYGATSTGDPIARHRDPVPVRVPAHEPPDATEPPASHNRGLGVNTATHRRDPACVVLLIEAVQLRLLIRPRCTRPKTTNRVIRPAAANAATAAIPEICPMVSQA